MSEKRPSVTVQPQTATTTEITISNGVRLVADEDGVVLWLNGLKVEVYP